MLLFFERELSPIKLECEKSIVNSGKQTLPLCFAVIHKSSRRTIKALTQIIYCYIHEPIIPTIDNLRRDLRLVRHAPISALAYASWMILTILVVVA